MGERVGVRRMTARRMTAGVCALLFAGLAGVGVPAAGASSDGVRGRLEWRMPDRYVDVDGATEPLRDDVASLFDHDEDGLPDSGSAPWDYVDPASWRVELDACGFTSSVGIVNYHWTVAGAPAPFDTTACRTDYDFPKLDVDYRVDIAVTDADGFVANDTVTVRPRNFLVVGMGDSFGSGEGNPERPAHETWTDVVTSLGTAGVANLGTLTCSAVSIVLVPSAGPACLGTAGVSAASIGPMLVHDWSGGPPDSWGDTLHSDPPLWANRRCHRSGLAGQAQAAARLEADDDHSSVTFLHVACSGAQIGSAPPTTPGPDGGGILSYYGGVKNDDDNPPGLPPLPPQFTQVEQMITRPGASGHRKIDSVMLSIGGNDFGFGDIVVGCIVLPNCNKEPLYSPLPRTPLQALAEGNAYLPERYEHLDAALEDLVDGGEGSTTAQRSGRVILSTYPNLVRDENDEPCADILPLGPYGGLFERDETTWADEKVLVNLDDLIVSKGGQLGWNVVDMRAAFSRNGNGHGYCAGQSAWVRTITQSIRMQGNVKGGFHPNQFGHQAYADVYYDSANGLRHLLLDPAAAPAAASIQQPCAPEAVTQFGALESHPDVLGFRKYLGEDPEPFTHRYEGVQRVPGGTVPRLVASRSGVATTPIDDDEPARLVWARIGSQTSDGERLASNRVDAVLHTEDTPPRDYFDRVDRVVRFNGASGYPGYAAAGGLQVVGSTAVVALSRPLDASDKPGAIFIGAAATGRPITTLKVDYAVEWAGAAAYEGGLLVLAGSTGAVHAYLVTGLGTRTITWSPLDDWDRAERGGGDWPTGSAGPQSGSLVRDCNGDLVLVTTRNTGGQPHIVGWPVPSGDEVGDAWIVRLTTTGSGSSLALDHAVEKTFDCYWFNGLSAQLAFDPVNACSFAAGAGAYVSPTGELSLYGIGAGDDGPDGTVEMGQFSNEWGFRLGGPAWAPTAKLVSGSTVVAAGSAVTFDATPSAPPRAKARVSLYSDPNFGDRRATMEWSGRNPPFHENFTNLSDVDEIDDTVSSFRWRLPPGCDAKLADDARTGNGGARILVGNGAALAVPGFDAFGASYLYWEPRTIPAECSGDALTFAWDVGRDGTVDGTGPTFTYSPAATAPEQVVPASVRVCGVWSECSTRTFNIEVEGRTRVEVRDGTLEIWSAGDRKDDIRVTRRSDGALSIRSSLAVVVGGGCVAAGQLGATCSVPITAVRVSTDAGDDAVTLSVAGRGAGGEVIGSVEVTGGDGADRIAVAGSVAQLFGGRGNDNITMPWEGGTADAGAGSDTVTTRTPPRTVTVVPGVTILGGPGADSLKGGIGADTIDGGASNDAIDGMGGADVLRGGDGDDALNGGRGTGDDDTIDGGAGSDLLRFDDVSVRRVPVAVDVDLGAGTAVDRSGGGTFGHDAVVAVERVRGTMGNDLIAGDTAANAFDGRAGNDVLRGRDGDDAIKPGPGDDDVDGGDGTDTFDSSDTARPLIVDLLAHNADGNGHDTVVGVESVVGGAGADHVTGDAGANVLIGGAGDDWLEGGDGADRLFGGDGADRLDGGNGADLLDGGANDDELHGAGGDDMEWGGPGDDHFDQGVALDGGDELWGDSPNRRVEPVGAVPGIDTVDYGNRECGTVVATADDVADDGAAGEADNVHSDVEELVVPECGADRDADGVDDGSDNCPDEPNADQADADGDAIGDACEPSPGHIVFASDRAGAGFDIWIMNSDGTDKQRLTEAPEYEDEPVFSPDGSRIAFYRYDSVTGNPDLFVMNRDGSGLHDITNTPGASEWSPSWSPDGTRLVYQGDDGLYVVDADGSDPVRITDFASGAIDYYPAWSPVGDVIAFERKAGEATFGIWTVNADGTDARPVVDGPLDEEYPAWSPDGTHLAFTRGSSFAGPYDDTEIWTVAVDGTGLTQLTADTTADFYGPTWSRDGRQIAWHSERSGAGDIWTMNADGTRRRNATADPFDDITPDWGA